MSCKNLLFVFADQWRRMAMGCAGQDPVLTPRMDAFASKSMYCTDATSSFPLCSPHRASLFTGRWPQSTGMFTNCKPGLSVRLRDEEVCVGEVMKENGYRTAYIGKWHLDEPEINHSPEPLSGARDWDAYTPPGVRRHGFDYWYAYNTCDTHLTPHYWIDSPEPIRVEQWSPEHETDVAIRYLKDAAEKEQPFALFLSWNPPHSPYHYVPEQYRQLYKDLKFPVRENVDAEHLHYHTPEASKMTEEDLQQATRDYFAAVSGLDEQFGRLLDSLKELGLDENTIVVLTADHGDMMGSHGLMAKHVWYEESIGIPMVVGGAGIPQGTCGKVIGSADVAPTLLELLDLPVPDTMEGRSAAKELLTGAACEDSFTYLYACPGGLALLEPLQKAGIDPKSMGWRGIRSKRYTYIVDAGYAPDSPMQRLLYDLQQDPMQQAPQKLRRAAECPEAEVLEGYLAEWLEREHDPFLPKLNKESSVL